MTLHHDSGQSESGHSEIYAQGYEKWTGEREYFIPSWLLIGKTVLRNVIVPSGCLGRLIFLMFCIFLGIYYFFVAMSSFAHFQYENLKKSEAFGFFATFNRGASGHDGSKDKAANALQVYFSKAISRFDYVGGKLFVVGVLTSFTTLIPGAMIVLIGLFFNTNLTEFMAQAWYIPLIVIVFWGMWTAVFGAVTLVFSAMFNKSYMAAVAIIGFVGFCSVFALLLEQIVGSNGLVDGLNWFGSLYSLGAAMFDREVESWANLIWRIFDLAVICLGGYYLVFRKINPVEVIK